MAVAITSIAPPRGRSGDQIVITGTGFAAANNSVDIILPDSTVIAQTITAESTTEITIATTTGALTKDFHNGVRVTNDDDSTAQTRHWFVPKDLADLAVDFLASQQPGPNEVVITEFDQIAEAKDFERLAAMVEFLRDDVSGGGGAEPSVAGGRLTLSSSLAVTVADVTVSTNVHYLPFRSESIALPTNSDATAWAIFSIGSTGLTLALGTLVIDTNYDVFCFDSGGTPTLEFSAAWSTDVARADAVNREDGVFVKTSDKTRRLIGSIRTVSTTETTDTETERFVFNANPASRVPRTMVSPTETTTNWSYNGAAYRYANNSSANRVDFLVGLPEEQLRVRSRVHLFTASGTANIAVGIGLDSSTVNSANHHGETVGAGGETAHAQLLTYPGIGFHFAAWIEASQSAAVTITWEGDGNIPTYIQSGLQATMRM